MRIGVELIQGCPSLGRNHNGRSLSLQTGIRLYALADCWQEQAPKPWNGPGVMLGRRVCQPVAC